MGLIGWLQAALPVLLVVALVKPVGWYLHRVYAGEATVLSPLLRPVERGLYRLAGVDPGREQDWRAYAMSVLVLHIPGMLLLYGLMRLQALLPWNPAGQEAATPDLAFNTAVSFATNTSWQSYGGETTLSHLVQMAGITVQSIVSCAVGLAVAMALVRGIARRKAATVGNAWADIVRGVLYVLLPVCVVMALVFAWQGVPQTLLGSVDVATLEGGKQTIALGPVASQEAVKLLSGDGGGFFNAQSAHPFENPTWASNVLSMVLMAVLGAALTNTFGRAVGDQRQGWALLWAMLVLLGGGGGGWGGGWGGGGGGGWGGGGGAGGVGPLASLGLDPAAGNMEGKEVRFGLGGSVPFSALATATSSGAVNSMLDSYTPLGGLVLLGNMMLDEVVIGGPGSGLWGVLLFAIVAVFAGGLMIGRTPDYVGKKIEAREVTLTMLALLVVPAALLVLTAVACVVPAGVAALGNAGPHGFTEMLYAYTSAANTNGSAFAGLSTNTPFWNLTLAGAMLVGRLGVIIPVLALAGRLAGKARVPASSGTLPTTGVLWVVLLVGTVVIVGGLTFFPALALGPIAEHLAMVAGGRF
jgi:K+-transporting ATPase ATPase A chain